MPTQKQEAPYNYKTPPLTPFSLFPPHDLSMLRLMIAHQFLHLLLAPTRGDLHMFRLLICFHHTFALATL
jgi:hypothetical protein